MKSQQKKTGIYLRFALMIVVSALVGGLLSMLVNCNLDRLSDLGSGVSGGLYRAGLPLLASGLVWSAVSTGVYLSARGPMRRAEEDDDAFETANRRLCLAMILNSLLFPWIMITIALAVVPATGTTRFFGLTLAILLLLLVWSIAVQALCVQATKKLSPEKRGNVFDTRFQRDWYASCDEAEQKTIGDCSYFTFRVMNLVYPFAMVALLIVGMYWQINAMWFVLVGGLWLLQMGCYQLRCYRLQHSRRTHGKESV